MYNVFIIAFVFRYLLLVIMDIEQLEQYVALRCVPHYDYGYFMRFLVFCQFTPLYLTAGMYAVTLTFKYQELYYRFFSLGLTLNSLLNTCLQYLIRSEPHIQNCGGGNLLTMSYI
jgi:hypothetical protein